MRIGATVPATDFPFTRRNPYEKTKGALSLLLILAMLTVALATFFPAAVSAEGEEIQNLGYQSSSNFAIGGESTDLRFLFTVGSLHYSEVGFVFSFEEYGLNKTPEIGATGCFKVAVNKVYSTIRAGGEPQNAPDGRWWVAAKLTNIPFANFCDWIYVRAFVTDNEGTRYSDAVKLNVLTANRGEGESINEAIGTSSTGSNAYIDCKRNIYTDVLDSGAKTFCPTAENPTGNDLLIEYSVLYNEYLVQYLKNDNGPSVTARIGKEDFSKNSPLSWWTPCANCYDCYCVYPGGFESTAHIETPVSDGEVTTPVGMVSSGGTYTDYPNIGGSDPENPEYGWHRIGFRIHEEVTALPTANTEAEYLITVTTYVDGVAVAKLQGPLNDDRTANYLYTATYNASSGKVEYTDIGSDKYVFLYRMKYKGITASSDKDKHFAYCVFADAIASCGKEFVQQVERVVPVDYGPHDGGYRAANEKGMAEGNRYYRIVPDDVPDFSGSISVMSYNIEVYDKDHGTGWDGRDYEKALETVLYESPDIVGFQEVNSNWDESLASAAAAGGYTRLTGDYTKKYSWEKNEIFFKTSKFTKIAEGTKNYRDTAAELGVPNTENADQSLDTIYRIFHYVVLQEKSSGKRFLVVNTHLYYGSTGHGAEEHDKVRRYEIRTLLAWLASQAANLPAYQIVLGDMNAYFRSNNGGKANMDLYSDGGFVRTSAAAEIKYDVGGTLANNGRSTRQEYVFDYILTRGNIDTAYYTVVPNPIDDGKYPSDHIPVLAKIYLR